MSRIKYVVTMPKITFYEDKKLTKRELAEKAASALLSCVLNDASYKETKGEFKVKKGV